MAFLNLLSALLFIFIAIRPLPSFGFADISIQHVLLYMVRLGTFPLIK